MAERYSVYVKRDGYTRTQWEDDIVAAAIKAAGLVVSEEDRANPAYTESDAKARGQRIGIMAKAILEELSKS